ncbi:unnamed protein product [Rotaria sp. Silwood1]|nr:unnamed protein product [Rotaria sp. Silwood1]
MALSIVIFVIVSILIDGTHYRGGFITWKPQYPHIINQNPVAIILKQRHVWRRSSIFCNDTTITTKGLIGNGSVNCISTCSTTGVLASVSAPCVAYSIKNDWSVGEVSTVINVSANVKFEAAFQGGSWISTLGVGADGGWSISAEITTIPRSDVSILINGSHYRGGFITWKPQYPHIINQNPVAIILKQRHVWRRSSIFCNDITITTKGLIGGGSVHCISTCSTTGVLASVSAPCVAYSIKNDWSVGEVSTVINVSANVKFEAAFQGGSWISTLDVGAGGRWSISAEITTIPRSDGSMKPVGQVYSNQSVWYIEYTNEVRRPSLDAYVRFYSNSTNKQVHQINVRTNLKDVIFSKNTLTFFTSINWILGEHYYILLDRSVVTDPSVCGPQSPPVNDVNFWTFEVQSEGESELVLSLF